VDEVGGLFERLPVGWSTVEYAGRRYGVTRSVATGGRSEKVLAEALDGSDLVSANLYRLTSENVLRPCEMPEQKVLDFLRGQRPDDEGSAPARRP
jgi:peptide-methionine (S)-S-oxide reductase